jgi:hypothetical protein
MGMGEQDPVNPGRVNRKGIPVFQAVALEPLKEAAVDKQRVTVCLQKKA